jgi:hypothetical protein
VAEGQSQQEDLDMPFGDSSEQHKNQLKEQKGFLISRYIMKGDRGFLLPPKKIHKTI